MGLDSDYLKRLRDLHRELGIPEDYSVSRRLTLHEEAAPERLVKIGVNPDGRLLELLAPAATAWRLLREEASREGVELIAVSAFRSVARQTEIIQRKLDDGKPITEILRYVAAPGFSEHHTGRAIDIGCPGFTDLEENFEDTPAFIWLQRRAADYSFSLSYPRESKTGISYEPWHWFWSESAQR